LVVSEATLDLIDVFIEREIGVEQASRELGKPVDEVRALVEELIAAAILEVAAGQPGEGGEEDEVLYKLNWGWLDDDRWAQLSLRQRSTISAAIGHLITGEIDLALEVGTFDARIDRHLTRAQLVVDEQGWRDLMRIHDEAFRASIAARDRSAERLRQSGKPGIEGRSVQVLFEMPRSLRP
jgi:hypothetical protein